MFDVLCFFDLYVEWKPPLALLEDQVNNTLVIVLLYSYCNDIVEVGTGVKKVPTVID